MKMGVVVHGRFQAFDLVRALPGGGHDVTVLTNYPKWAARRFGIPPERVRSFWAHGIAAKAAYRLRDMVHGLEPDPFLSPLFGRWASEQLRRESWDVIHTWSGVSEEILRAP